MLSRAFTIGNSAFNRWFEQLRYYTDYVLKKCHDEDVLEGKAEAFSFKDPHNPFPRKNLKYLFTIEDVLDPYNWNQPEKLQWFCRHGPRAIHFRKGLIYCRQGKLACLKKSVQENSATLLRGDRATGKTVLALHMACTLFDQGGAHIYYFDCDRRRNFNENELREEMNYLEGILILDNIYLEVGKFQFIYQAFKNDVRKHILFITHPSYKKNQYGLSAPLDEIKNIITLDPFEDIDELLSDYCSGPSHPQLSLDIRKKLKDISEKNLWLLSFAIDGYVRWEGRGNPIDWLETGIQDQLGDLKKCQDTYASQYPRILLALAPLYKNGVWTSRKFLVDKLQLNPDALDDLVDRQEISEQVLKDDTVMYGLPSSTHAEAYWRYGKKHWIPEAPEYEDFVYNYAISGVPNGLEAAIECDWQIKRDIFEHLERDGKLAEVIDKEKSFRQVFNWAKYNSRHIIADEPLTNTLREKIRKHDDIAGATTCLSNIWSNNPELGETIWKLLDKQDIARKILQADIDSAGWSVCQVFESSKTAGDKLWAIIDKKVLAGKLLETLGTSEARVCMRSILAAGKDVAKDVYDHLNIEFCSARLNNMAESDVCLSLNDIYWANPDVGRKLQCSLANENLRHKVEKDFRCVDERRDPHWQDPAGWGLYL